MKPGETFEIPHDVTDGPYIATFGNTNGVVIRIGNREIALKGQRGRALHNVQLTEEALLKRAAGSP